VPLQPQGRSPLRPLPPGPLRRQASELAEKGADSQQLRLKGRDVGSRIGAADDIDFKKLGHKDGPILSGGRFKTLPLGYGATKK
jgi:hypothetical protein